MKKYPPVNPRSFYTPTQEIELVELVIILAHIVKKYAGTIIVLLTISVLCSLAAYFSQREEYESILFFNTPSLSNSEVEQIFELINKNIGSRNITTLEGEYGLKSGTIDQLKKITVITTEEAGAFRILTIGYSNNYVAELTTQLSWLLTRRNNDASQGMIAELDKKIQAISAEIDNIDNILAHSRNVNSSQSVDQGTTGILMKLKLELIKERLELEINKEEMNREIGVFSTQKYAHRRETAPGTYLLIGTAIALSVSCLLIAYKELRLEILKRKRVFANDPIARSGKFHYN